MSDVVLSLFAVDVLAHREFHEQLCVCDVCGDLVQPGVTRRRLLRSRPRERSDQRRTEAED